MYTLLLNVIQNLPSAFQLWNEFNIYNTLKKNMACFCCLNIHHFFVLRAFGWVSQWMILCTSNMNRSDRNLYFLAWCCLSDVIANEEEVLFWKQQKTREIYTFLMYLGQDCYQSITLYFALTSDKNSVAFNRKRFGTFRNNQTFTLQSDMLFRQRLRKRGQALCQHCKVTYHEYNIRFPAHCRESPLDSLSHFVWLFENFFQNETSPSIVMANENCHTKNVV